MRTFVLVVMIALALAGMTWAMIGVGILPVLAGAAGGAALATVALNDVVRRDWRMRHLIAEAYRADTPTVRLEDASKVMCTPEVMQARRDYLSREAAILAQRYANGDASDY